VARDLETPVLVDRLFRTQAGRLVAHFTRRFGPANLDLAEEVVQDALVKALQQWPFTGVPANPAGWLFRVASNEALDVLRRRTSFAARVPDVAYARRQATPIRKDPAIRGEAVDDDELRMVLMCCHPALPLEGRVALSLKTVSGLGVPEIARALLSSERAVAQRLVRSKRQLREIDPPFDLPAGPDLAERVDNALDVIYLLFNAGYSAHGGDNLVRADLCREAVRLGRLVADAGDVATPRAHALLALMAFHAAREAARVDAHGELVRLDEQDRTKWDSYLIAVGFAELDRSMDGHSETAFHVQAAIAATHAAARHAQATDWKTILDLYDALLAMDPSPVVRLNRAVAVSQVRGAAAGLAALAPLVRAPALAGYYLLPAVRADLLVKVGKVAEARRSFRAALACPCSLPERRFLESRMHNLSRRAS
jgi:RNA polymerase sigma-70 factor (ECF subfamily)